MAGFEIVVRPVVIPNIRPAPARSLPPQDDPDKGFAVIRGNGANQVSLSNNYNASTTSSKRKETKRRVDEVRVYQQDNDGTVNRGNFVDLEVANKIWMNEGKAPASKDTFAKVYGDPMIEEAKSTMDRIGVYYYQRIQEKKNIEITKRDVIKKPDEQTKSGE